jgi:hypothetical protein
MTRYLKLFALCAALWTGLWFLLLYRLLHEAPAPGPALVSCFVVFTVVLSSLERYFKARDDQRPVRYNLSLRYSLVAAAASILLSSGWALAWQRSLGFVLLLGAASVIVVVAAALVGTRRRIKAYTKDELFQ